MSPLVFRRFLAAAVLAFLSLLTVIPSSPAAAHGSINSTLPADGSVVEERPEFVEIFFNEKVITSPESARLLDSESASAALVEEFNRSEGSGAMVRWSLPVNIQRGWYAVAWNAVSADGHPISGSFTFFYGDPSAAGTATRAQEVSDPTRPYVFAAHVLRTLTYLAVLLAVGLLCAFWAVSGPATTENAPLLAQRLRRGSSAAAILGLILTPLVLVNNSLILNAGSLESLTLIIQIVLRSSSGAALLIRMSALFGLCTAVLLLAERPTRKIGAAIGALAALALTYSFPLAGHASVVPWKMVAAPAETLHLLAAALWLGAIPGVLLAILNRSALSVESLAEVVSRFSKVATVTVVAVMVGGLALSSAMFSSPTEVFTTRYGITLLVKFLLVGIAAALGAYNHFVLVPTLRKTDPSQDAVLAARGHLRTSLLAEAGVFLAIVLATGALTAAAAPAAGGNHFVGGGHSHGGGAGGPELDLTTALEDLEPKILQAPFAGGEVRLDYLPGRAGAENRFRLSVTDASGAERALSQVRATFTHSEAGVGPLERVFARDIDGSWLLQTRDLGIPGVWETNLRVEFSNGDIDTVTFQVSIRPARSAGVVP
jgi:copper transport protein